jgi:hypothetical protein
MSKNKYNSLENQSNFSALSRARVSIENAWALFKNRFPVLRTQMRFKDPEKNAKIIKALAYLHNFLIDNRDDAPRDIEGIENEEDEEEIQNRNAQGQHPRVRILFEAFKDANDL